MDKLDFLYQELHQRYGNVRRARGCFLYTEKNVRLTDLYQENGRAILGWGGANGFTFLKNVLSRGQTGSFPTQHLYQLKKAVGDLLNFPVEILVFNSRLTAKNAAEKLGLEVQEYIPWACEENLSQDKAVLVCPPLAWCEEAFVLAVPEEVAASKNDVLSKIESNRFAPCLLQAYARSIYDLIQALQLREEKQWFLYDTVLNKYFVRKGPYLEPKVPAEKYDAFVKHCLDCGIVINPNSEGKSIVPFGADKGVFEKLRKNPFNM